MNVIAFDEEIMKTGKKSRMTGRIQCIETLYLDQFHCIKTYILFQNEKKRKTANFNIWNNTYVFVT